MRRGSKLAIAGAVLLVAGLRWMRPFRVAVEGDSMEPTVREGQFLVAARAHRVHRGDVVVVRRPDRDLEVVKRVIGLPGESVRLSAGRVEVDGRPLRERYAHGAGPDGAWRLGEGEYLVLGDNRDRSTDGRTFGPVPRDAVTGLVWFRYWPTLSRLR